MTNVRALVGAGKTGVSSVPGGGKRISIRSTMPSFTSSSAIRSGVSARLRRIGASHLARKLPSAKSAQWLIGPFGLVLAELGEGDPLGMQPRLVHPIVFGVVLPGPGSGRDLRQDLPPVSA